MARPSSAGQSCEPALFPFLLLLLLFSVSQSARFVRVATTQIEQPVDRRATVTNQQLLFYLLVAWLAGKAPRSTSVSRSNHVSSCSILCCCCCRQFECRNLAESDARQRDSNSMTKQRNMCKWSDLHPVGQPAGWLKTIEITYTRALIPCDQPIH